MSDNLELLHLPTDETVAMLKIKHSGPLTLVTLPKTTDGSPARCFILKKPDLKTIKAMTAVGQNDPVGGTEVLVKNCLVWATDETALDDVTVFLAVAKVASTLAEERVAVVKNL